MAAGTLSTLVSELQGTGPVPRLRGDVPCLAGAEMAARYAAGTQNKPNSPRFWPENAGDAKKQTQFGTALVAPNQEIVCATPLSSTHRMRQAVGRRVCTAHRDPFARRSANFTRKSFDRQTASARMQSF
jgi:hypothetical protein